MSTEQLRVGDRERDEVTSALHEHFAQGRLTREELDERLTATLSARTVGDLRKVTSDLPGTSDVIPILSAGAGGRVPDGPAWRGAWWAASAPYPGQPPLSPPWAHAATREWGSRPGPPFGLFLIPIFMFVAFTGGWMLFPLFAGAWFVIALFGFRHARRWHRPVPPPR